jgi:hypothetical protein
MGGRNTTLPTDVFDEFPNPSFLCSQKNAIITYSLIQSNRNTL